MNGNRGYSFSQGRRDLAEQPRVVYAATTTAANRCYFQLLPSGDRSFADADIRPGEAREWDTLRPGQLAWGLITRRKAVTRYLREVLSRTIIPAHRRLQVWSSDRKRKPTGGFDNPAFSSRPFKRGSEVT